MSNDHIVLLEGDIIPEFSKPMSLESARKMKEAIGPIVQIAAAVDGDKSFVGSEEDFQEFLDEALSIYKLEKVE